MGLILVGISVIAGSLLVTAIVFTVGFSLYKSKFWGAALISIGVLVMTLLSEISAINVVEGQIEIDIPTLIGNLLFNVGVNALILTVFTIYQAITKIEGFDKTIGQADKNVSRLLPVVKHLGHRLLNLNAFSRLLELKNADNREAILKATSENVDYWSRHFVAVETEPVASYLRALYGDYYDYANEAINLEGKSERRFKLPGSSDLYILLMGSVAKMVKLKLNNDNGRYRYYLYGSTSLTPYRWFNWKFPKGKEYCHKDNENYKRDIHELIKAYPGQVIYDRRILVAEAECEDKQLMLSSIDEVLDMNRDRYITRYTSGENDKSEYDMALRMIRGIYGNIDVKVAIGEEDIRSLKNKIIGVSGTERGYLIFDKERTDELPGEIKLMRKGTKTLYTKESINMLKYFKANYHTEGKGGYAVLEGSEYLDIKENWDYLALGRVEVGGDKDVEVGDIDWLLCIACEFKPGFESGQVEVLYESRRVNEKVKTIYGVKEGGISFADYIS